MLLLGHERANPQATERSWELIAQHVVPHFQGGAVSHAQQTLDAEAHASGKREDYAAQQLQAVATMTERYQQEVAGGR
jgi:limonene 1,2-monooxygenase